MQVGRREVAGLAVVALVGAVALLMEPGPALAALAALAARPLPFAAALLAVYLMRPLLGWPTAAVSVLVGYALGPRVGLPVALVGAVVTSLPPFYAARWWQAGEGLVGRLGDGGRAYFGTAGDVRGVAAARLAPLPADPVSAAAGLAGVPLWAYAAGTLVGELPWTGAAVVLGASAATIADAGLSGAGVPLVAGTALAALVLLAAPLYRAVRGVDRRTSA